MQTNRFLSSLIFLVLILSACQSASPAAIQAVAPLIPVTGGLPATSSPQANPNAASAPSPVASPASISPTPQAVGPDPANIPVGYNPLTGQPAVDPSVLNLPAVLVSITNFPPSARPQSGLSFSPWVFEFYIAEGMTRYLAAFYGGFPKAVSSSPQANAPQTTTDAQIGPVRSGRISYVHIRDFYQGSCLVYASATEQIRAQLRGCAMVFGNDASNINSAMLDTSRLQKIAQENKRPTDQFDYSGNLFTSNPSAQGAPASQISVFYSYLNQAQWQFDPASGDYLKFDDFADGSGKFTPATDRLTGDQLAFANVVILFGKHIVINPYIIDVNLAVGEKGPAVIFRDGQMYPAFWSTVADAYEQTSGLRRPLRLVDASGQPFALKPGHTWVHIVTPASQVQDLGAGAWKLRFYAPAGAK